MKKILTAAAIAALASTQALAQASNFTGFSAAANVNTSSANTEIRGGGVSGKTGDSSQNVTLQAAYGLAVGSNGVLGFGATYGLGDVKAGSFSAGGDRYDIKGKDMYSLYVEPGYAVSNSTLVYAKLAYLGMKGESSFNGATGSDNFDGVGYGLGVRTLLDKNLFLQVEFKQSDYSEQTVNNVSYKPSGSTGTIGIGYRF
jgi:outer membrane immunogenic protein